MNKNVTSGCILPSISGVCWNFTSVILQPFAKNIYFISVRQ
jgi:hypothetical protein